MGGQCADYQDVVAEGQAAAMRLRFFTFSVYRFHIKIKWVLKTDPRSTADNIAERWNATTRLDWTFGRGETMSTFNFLSAGVLASLLDMA